MSPLDTSPTRVSAGLALASAGLAVLLVSTASPAGATIGGLGWVSCLLGLWRRSQRWISLGSGVLWVAVILGGTAGLPVIAVLGATVLSIITWDTGRRAIDVGAHLTQTASTRRVELLHGATTTLVGAGTTLVVYGLAVLTPPRHSILAIAALFLAAFTLLWTLYST